MPSKYEALLDEPPASKYDALLAEPVVAQEASQLSPLVRPSSLLETLSNILGKARDIGTEALSPISPALSARVFGQTSSSLRPEQISPPLISSENAKAFVGELPSWAGGQTEFVKGATEQTAEAISGLSAPGALAQLPILANPAGATLFAANTILDLPKQARSLGETLGEHGLLSKESGAAVAEAGITDLMGLLAGKSGVGARYRAAERITGERAAPKIEEQARPAEPAVEPPVRAPEMPIEAPPVEIPPGSPESVLAAAISPEAPKNIVEPSGRSSVAQGDLDALRASNAARLAEEAPVTGTKVGGPALFDTEGNVIIRGKLGDTHADLEIAAIGTPNEAAAAKANGVQGQHGFVDDAGNPIRGTGPEGPQYREAAAKLGVEAGQLLEGTTAAQSQMFKPEAVPNEPISSATGARANELGAPAGETLGAENVQAAPVSVVSDVARPEGAGIGEPATASVGPGAASIKEPLASYELRRFGERLQEDQSIDPAIREQTGNRYYEPISNKVTVTEAEGIIEKRGTDESIRLVRDEEFAMQPRVRVTVGEALIKKLNQSHQEAKAAGNEVHADEFLQQAVDTAEYLSGYGTTLGQGVQAFAIWNKLTPEGRLMEATRIAKKSGIELTPEQTKRIGELNAEIEKAPEGFQKTEKTQDLMSYMSEIKGINPADVPIALWYSNILSGFTTQLVNTVDTGLNIFSESVAMAATHPAAIPDIIGGLYRGMIKGGFEAASTLKTGRSISGDKLTQQRVLERVQFGKEGGVPVSTDTRLGRFLKTAFESKAAIPLNLWKYPLRAMVASDTVFFNSFKEARARIMARALAKNEGLSGDALFKRVEEVLNQSPETLDAALKQAQDEGLTGLQQRRRVQEIVEQGRSEELVDSATEAAQIATYNHEPSGVIGLVASNISNITEGFPPAKAIVPFTRIVANVTNRGLNYTPWGYKRLFFGEWGGKKFGTEPPTGEAYRTQLVKATLGTTAMTAIAMLDANDAVQVTASGPDSINEKKQLQNTGWKPYSVKIGDTFYSYQYTPLNLGLAMVGHYRDAIRYNKLSEKDAATRLAYGMLKSSSTIFDMSFLSGVSDFLETIQGTTSSTKGAGRLFSRTASSVVVPNLVKQVDKLFDPTIYQADTITQALIRETPVARSAVLKPMLNVLGESIEPSQNRFFTFDSNDPVWQLIVEKQAWVPVPSKTSKIGDRPITPDEYYRLIKESGPQIRDYISSNLGRLRDMTGEQAQDDIQKESQRIRRVVKSRF